MYCSYPYMYTSYCDTSCNNKLCSQITHPEACGEGKVRDDCYPTSTTCGFVPKYDVECSLVPPEGFCNLPDGHYSHYCDYVGGQCTPRECRLIQDMKACGRSLNECEQVPNNEVCRVIQSYDASCETLTDEQCSEHGHY